MIKVIADEQLSCPVNDVKIRKTLAFSDIKTFSPAHTANL